MKILIIPMDHITIYMEQDIITLRIRTPFLNH